HNRDLHSFPTRRSSDLSFFVAEKLPLLNRQKHVQRFVPDLAIEIASPTDRVSDLWRKKDRYLAAGTREVWLIMPETREVFIYPRSEEHTSELQSRGHLV